MKLAVIISSNDVKTCWDAFRYANYSLDQKDDVKIFLMNKGVEHELISTPQFNIIEQSEKFLNGFGKIYACEARIKTHEHEEPSPYPVITLKDLYQTVKESDRVVTF